MKKFIKKILNHRIDLGLFYCVEGVFAVNYAVNGSTGTAVLHAATIVIVFIVSRLRRKFGRGGAW